MGIPTNISRNERVLLKGLIEELGGGASTLAELNDVDVANPTGGDTLVWDEEMQKFVSSTPTAPGTSPGVLDSVTTSFAAAAANPQTVNPGTIIWLPEPAYVTANPPIGYMHASGSNRVRSEYPDLFNAIGTTFNNECSTGTTFGIPNELELDNPYAGIPGSYRGYIRTGVVSALTGLLLSGAVGGSQFRTFSVTAGNAASALNPYTLPFNMERQQITANGAYGVAWTGGADTYQVLRRVGSNWTPCTVEPAYGGSVILVAALSNTGNYLVIGGNLGTFVYERIGDDAYGNRQTIDEQGWRTQVWFNANDTAMFGSGDANAYRLSILQDGEWTEAVTRMTAYNGWPWNFGYVAFNPTNSLVAATTSSGLQIFSRVGQTLDVVPGSPANLGGATPWVDFSADGQYLICGAFQSWGDPPIQAWRVQDQNFTPITVDESVYRRTNWNSNYQTKALGRSINTWVHGTEQALLTIVNDVLAYSDNNVITGISGMISNQLITSGFIPA